MMKNIFLNRTENFPALYIDMVLVESIRPILFTCIDEDGQLYICSCCFASGDKCIWIVADTTLNDVISLLRNECEIRDMFGCHECLTVITKYGQTEDPEICTQFIQNIPKDFLPTKGYYMEVEEGEFEDELEELNSRLKDSYQYNESFQQTSFDLEMFKTFVSFKPKIPIQIPNIGFWTDAGRMAIETGV